MHAYKRIAYDIIFGIEASQYDQVAYKPILSFIDEQLTRISGGPYREIGSGTWTTGSSENDFTGTIEQTISIKYHLIFMPDTAEQAIDKIKTIFADVKTRYDLPIQYVQVMRYEGTAYHFKLE